MPTAALTGGHAFCNATSPWLLPWAIGLSARLGAHRPWHGIGFLQSGFCGGALLAGESGPHRAPD